jgi:hypothetical protein
MVNANSQNCAFGLRVMKTTIDKPLVELPEFSSPAEGGRYFLGDLIMHDGKVHQCAYIKEGVAYFISEDTTITVTPHEEMQKAEKEPEDSKQEYSVVVTSE